MKKGSAVSGHSAYPGIVNSPVKNSDEENPYHDNQPRGKKTTDEVDLEEVADHSVGLPSLEW